MIKGIFWLNSTSAKVALGFYLVMLGVIGLWTQDVIATSNNEEDDENNNEGQEQEHQQEEAPAATASEFVPETCFTLTIPECNEVNAKFATQQTFSPRCQVTLADGQLITIYKEPTKSCSTSQDELVGMTYQRYQEEEMQKLSNEINESASKFGELLNPPPLSERLEKLTDAIEALK